MKPITLILSLLFVGFVYNCCVPPLLEGDVQIFSQVDNFYLYEYFYYDFHGGKLRADIYESLNNMQIQYSIIERYDQQRFYELFDGKCVYVPLTTPIRQGCIPPGGNEFNTVIGGSLNATVTIFGTNAGQNITEFGTTYPECYPLFGIFLSEHGSIYEDNFDINYWNILPTVRDPFVFEPPPGCVEVTSNSTMQHYLRHAKRFANNAN